MTEYGDLKVDGYNYIVNIADGGMILRDELLQCLLCKFGGETVKT